MDIPALRLSLAIMTYVEIADGFSVDHGFSPEDFAMDVIGAGLSSVRNAIPEAGEVLDEYARRLLSLEDELERELDALGTEIAGELLLGSSTGPGELVLPRLCAAFREANPKADVRLSVYDTQYVCERVLEGSLELGIVGAESGQRGLEFEPFLRDELIVAFELYCRIPFQMTKASYPEVQRVASLIQRSPASVARKLGNFGALDPRLQAEKISGLTHAGRMDPCIPGGTSSTERW